MKQKENLTLHRVSLRALFHAPLHLDLRFGGLIFGRAILLLLLLFFFFFGGEGGGLLLEFYGIRA